MGNFHSFSWLSSILLCVYIPPLLNPFICWWMLELLPNLDNCKLCCKIQPVHSEGDQPWDFFRRNDAKAETPVLWPPHAKSWLIGKDSDAGRDWGQEEEGTTEDEMAGWHHGLDGRESEWTPGDGDEQGGLVCCNSWGRKELDTTEWLKWTELNWTENWFCVSEFSYIFLVWKAFYFSINFEWDPYWVLWS